MNNDLRSLQLKTISNGLRNEQNEYSSQARAEQASQEEILWAKFKAGNSLAFSTLYRSYVQLLYNYGRHITPDQELVKDCLQELFSELWDKREKLADVQSVRHYLFKSFRRKLIGHLSRGRKQLSEHTLYTQSDFQITLPYETECIDQQAESEQRSKLQQAIGQLSKRQQEVIFLKFYNQLSYSDIASVMQMQVESVYNLISKALDLLRKTFKALVWVGALFCQVFFS
jgi:RNA polymerase sigma factor (sigma-70 family)